MLLKNKTKDVIRKFGWSFLKPGDIVRGVEKTIGLKPGEKVKALGFIEIVSINREPINEVTREDVVREGFPNLTPNQFIVMLTKHYNVSPDAKINRIEYKYL